ncbi:MAG: diguanylate cyclase domain-containing protein [Candidatus Malihini olakiniferum]
MEISLLNNSVVSVIVIDIDNFKNVHNAYEHDIGNEVIKMLGQYQIWHLCCASSKIISAGPSDKN